MIGKLKGVGLILVGCAAVTAVGQRPTNAENLLFSPPKNFKVGFQENRADRLMTEWVPADETVEAWTEMLTVEIYHRAIVDAVTFLGGVKTRYMIACRGTVAKGIFTAQANGYVVATLLLECPKNPRTGAPETTAFRVIKGTDALYSVQHAWRSHPSDQDRDDAIQQLSKVAVCDPRTPDHPCATVDAPVPSH